MIEIKHLKKSFGAHHVLKDVNLNIEEGKVTTILGGSGSGKSTLIKCMMRLQNATSGEILLNGRDITKEQNPMRLAALRRHFGYLFQGIHFLPTWIPFVLLSVLFILRVEIFFIGYSFIVSLSKRIASLLIV